MGRLSGLPLPLPKKSAGSSARWRVAALGTKRTGPQINIALTTRPDKHHVQAIIPKAAATRFAAHLGNAGT